MTDQQEFPPEVVEAVRREMCASCQGGGVCEVPPCDCARDVLRTLRGLGVLAGPGEVIMPVELHPLIREQGHRAQAQHVNEVRGLNRDVEIIEQVVMKVMADPVRAAQDAACYSGMVAAARWLAAAPRAGTEGGQ